jgi:hypothetical protein
MKLSHVKNPNAEAFYNATTNTVSITQGSLLNINLSDAPANNIAQNYRSLESYIVRGLAIKVNSNTVEVLKDLPYVSPSAASVMANGRAGSGWMLWRLENGQLLDSLRNQPAANLTNVPQTVEVAVPRPAARRQHQTNRREPNFPSIKYKYNELPPLNRDRFTISAMQTNMRKCGYRKYADLLPDDTNGDDLQRFEQAIIGDIRIAIRSIAEIPDSALKDIFHPIQLWGGNAGRNIYVKSGGFDQSFSTGAYRNIFKIIQEIDSIESFNDGVPLLKDETDRIGHWGVSFATKHFKFISAAIGTFQFPIYDTVVAQGLYGMDNANWKNYSNYVNDLHEFAHNGKYSVDIVERVLFNHFG